MDFLAGVPGKLKTLLDRLSSTWAAKLDTLAANYTATRAGKLDNLSAEVAPKSTALTNATWTDAKAAFLDAAITGRLGSIKSIQQGYIDLPAATGQATYTITAVNLAKSIILYLGASAYSGETNPGGRACRIELTNSTTVTAFHYAAGSTTSMYAAFMVVELN